MESVTRKLSPAVYVLVVVCFFLPFVSFSCQGQKIARFSGIQLVAGTSIQEPQMFGPPRLHKVDAEPIATLAFLCGLIGLGLSFLKGKNTPIVPAAAGGLGAILLLALRSKLERDAMKQGGGVIQVDYEVGFYMALIFFLLAVGLNAFILLQSRGVALPLPKAGGSYKFCAQCGARNGPTDLFCKDCGAKFP